MDNIKIFDEIEKEQETLTQTIRISIQDMGIRLGIEKRAMLIIKKKKEKQRKD